MPITLTPSQEKALDETRHLAIIANAGSGKTRVLVHRYVNILEDHPNLSPRNIVAITFTEASAAELKTRITDEVESRLKIANASNDQLKIERLTKIRNGLTGAYISTINAFASRLLRAYPVEAHVDATFGILADSDRELVVDETIQRVFESELRRAYLVDPSNDPLLNVFKLLGRDEVEKIIKALLDSRTKSRALTKYLNANQDAQILREWKEEIRVIFQRVIDTQMPRLLRVLDLCVLRKMTFEKFRIALQKHTPDVDTFAFLPIFREILSAGTSKQGCGGISGDLIKEVDRNDEAKQLHQAIAFTQTEYHKLFKEFTDEESFERSHEDYLNMLRPIMRLYALVEQAYVEIKTRYSVLDFDDQIEKLHNLVHRPELASELADAFPYILIDEYQDTDTTQFEIARALTLNFSTETKLSIVGDPKQSIYGFRNADLGTFDHAIEQIRQQTLSQEARDNSYALTNDETQGVITLAESFRMADAPLVFINDAFEHIFEAKDAEKGAGYAELVAARTPETAGSVGWLVHWEPKKLTAKQALAEDTDYDEDDDRDGFSLDPEYALIASKIRDIVEKYPETYPIGRTKPEDPVAPEYRDIVILLRTRKSIPELERTFVHYQIPYSVARGVGYFEQQEVIDLVGYLKFLVRPNDDIALFGILRSPIFALSDTFFFRLHLNFASEGSTSQTTLWERIQQACERPELCTESLLRAVTQLRENLALAGRLPASSILEKILRESAIAGVHRAMPNGAQRVANIHKLISLVRGFDSRGFSTLYDTVSRLSDQISRNDRESQASISDENSVKIMTVHGAKGLEFPVVFIPKLGHASKGSGSILIDEQKGIRARSTEAIRPLITQLLALEREQAESEEQKRILYVACTRARDHLFLSTKLTGDSAPKNSALSLFDPLTIARLFNLGSDSYTIEKSFMRYDPESGRSTKQRIALEIPIMRLAIPMSPESDSTALVEHPLPEFHLERFVSARGLGRFSPSQLLTFEECPTKYYLRYILGLPEEARLAYDMEPADLAESVRGTLVGQLIHKLLERVDTLSHNGRLDLNAFEYHFARIAGSLGVRPNEEYEYESRAKEDLDRFLGHELHTLIKEATRSHTEYMVQTSLSETDLLRGIVDRLFVAADGEIHILDYKTDKTTGAENPAKKTRYAFQLKFYAYLVSLLFPEKERIHATLYYTAFGSTESYTFGRKDFAGIESTLTEMIEKARGLENVTKLTSIERNLSHCRECAYFDETAQQCSVTAAATLD